MKGILASIMALGMMAVFIVWFVLLLLWPNVTVPLSIAALIVVLFVCLRALALSFLERGHEPPTMP